MNGTQDGESTRDDVSIEHYLPATPQLTNGTTRIEEFLTTVFRRRGERIVFLSEKN